jgi:signal transduction histidine kinase
VQVGRLTLLINSLLDVSSITAGRLVLEREDVDLAQLVREVIEREEDALAEARCEVRLEAPAPAVGRWDRLRLDQVVTNLVSNAMKFGAGKPIRVAVGIDGGTARVVVEDEGIGISAEAQARIFERFERAVSGRNFGGLGLGLWISRQIVQQSGGRIGVESQPGAGARFTVELPISV